MAVKKSPNDGKGTKAQLAALSKSKGMKPTEAVTKRGQKATGLAKSKSSDRFSSTAKTKVKGATSGFAGSGTPLGASMGVNPLNKKQIMNAAIAATGVGAVSRAASTFKVARKVVVSEGTKKLQRELSKHQKDNSMKRMSKLERQAEGEYRSEMDPTARAELYGRPNDLRKDISKSMKSTNKTKIVIKKK
jgi:hypothetical protein